MHASLEDYCQIVCSFLILNTATTAIDTLSLHDALPISPPWPPVANVESTSAKKFPQNAGTAARAGTKRQATDRKSTRLNSSHLGSTYAVFCLKKKTV